LKRAWQYFHETYGGGPVLDKSALCADCIYHLSKGILPYNEVNSELEIDLKSIIYQFFSFKIVDLSVETQEKEDKWSTKQYYISMAKKPLKKGEPGYWISKRWFSGLKQSSFSFFFSTRPRTRVQR
jgi:hypothetical protein